MVTTSQRIERALISVSDKSGIIDFARALADQKVELLSTGGSARALREAGIPVRDVSDYTGFPEIMDGRVKTLHPRIHGGLLARRDDTDHVEAMTDYGIGRIDLLVVNLYPFESTLAGGADFDTCIENIDVGGPAMIRAAAKNHAYVTVVTDPDDYAAVLDDMHASGGATQPELRKRLAAAAFSKTAGYDAAIASWLNAESGERYPRRFAFGGQRRQFLRYGENPHQSAAFYATSPERPGVATARQLQGKELSYNNINDTDAAFELAAEFDDPGIAIIKHANPCGAATGSTLVDAYDRALACDPVSAFGGIVACNRPVNESLAERLASLFLEVVIAPSFDKAAVERLAGKTSLRLLETGHMPDRAADGSALRPTIRTVSGGFLIQDADTRRVTADDIRVVTKRAPTDIELADMLFAFCVAKHVKSNAIVYVRNRATVGIGAGQMSRVDSSRIAARKAADAADAAGEATPATKGSVVASDAFFPFADGLDAAIEAGATAVIQPGGSIRDDEVIKAADDAGLAMVFTGIRHFRH
ncbi:bifunctional phosphoribosylaminoimidazolecarboxamide formyltransferase/IMP cyclohydrolase [Fodinicurvata sp. EGI_FJ10296]|uniref:bifunctional phosphoribosylaminoimidazolecarboxamide formyltransferase/IMP cyclohydrolase n=1 Tax=Fodinicurvata sp. EGI_FJ10296 TaxID=3231908 RepID=UPI0034548A2D